MPDELTPASTDHTPIPRTLGAIRSILNFVGHTDTIRATEAQAHLEHLRDMILQDAADLLDQELRILLDEGIPNRGLTPAPPTGGAA